MAVVGILAGVRVLDRTDESGRLAGKVLAQLGAEVIRIGTRPSTRVLEAWFDAGTARVDVDLDAEVGREELRRLAARADVFLETAPPGFLAERGLDAADLHRLNPRLVHVSLTPFGRRGPRAGWQSSDLVTAALGGLLSVCGTPEQPLNAWGDQWFNVGGLYAAICALAGVRAVRHGQRGAHYDLSLQHCATSCSEQLLMYWLHMSHVPGRQAALHWSGLYDVLPCRNGHVMVTPAPSQDNLLAWLAEDGMAGSLGENPPQHALEWAARAPEVMGVLRAWALTKDATELFSEGQRRNLSFGLVRSVGECAACPQHAARGFFAGEGGMRAPRLPFRFVSEELRSAGVGETRPLPVPPPEAGGGRSESAGGARSELAGRERSELAGGERSELEPGGRSELAGGSGSDALPRSPGEGQGGGAFSPESAPAPTPTQPLAGLRVLDFTWVLAGPMATRILADLGADVIKLQTEERSQGAGHNEFPFFLMWNRSKRSACLNMKHAAAGGIFRRLVAGADVVVDNFAPGVLDRWGVGWDTVRAWNPRAVYLAMSGCGIDGPWRDFVTFAPTIQALSGLTHLTNPPDRGDVGIGVSLNDHVSGLFGAVALLAALELRRRTGEGQFIDLSQLEVGSYLVGPALVDLLNGGPQAQPRGNADALGGQVPNEVYRCADGEWLALSVRDDAEWQRLCVAIGAQDCERPPPAGGGGSGRGRIAAEGELAQVEGRRRRLADIDARLAAWASAIDATVAMGLLQSAGLAAGVVQNARHLTDVDEQLAARRWLGEAQHATMGAQRQDVFPAWIDGDPIAPRLASPILGEHSFDVYRHLAGMSDEEIAAAIGEGLFV